MLNKIKRGEFIRTGRGNQFGKKNLEIEEGIKLQKKEVFQESQPALGVEEKL